MKKLHVQVGEFGCLNYGLFSWLESWPQLLKSRKVKTAAAPLLGLIRNNGTSYEAFLFFVK